MMPTRMSGARTRPEDGVEDPRPGDARDLVHRRQQRAVHVALAQLRQHVVLEDALAVLVREPGLPVTRARVELDLAVARVALVEVEQDHQPVVDAGAADAPLVHQGDGVRLGLAAA